MTTNLYESGLLRQALGAALRPGGARLTEKALDLCSANYGLRPGARILDLGCGPGATLGLLRGRGHQAFGLDSSPDLLREAAQAGPVFRALAQDPPLRPACLDALICECVLSLLPEPSAALAAWHAVLKPGGLLILADLTRKSACGPVEIPGQSCLASALPPESLRGLLREAGFEILLESDEGRALKELAARLILEFGSTQAFFSLWGRECGGGAQPEAGPQPGRNPSSGLGYLLLLAAKV